MSAEMKSPEVVKPVFTYVLNPRSLAAPVQVPPLSVDETLWPEFVQLDELLRKYLDEVTEKVIAEGIYEDVADAEVRRDPSNGLLSPPTIEK